MAAEPPGADGQSRLNCKVLHARFRLGRAIAHVQQTTNNSGVRTNIHLQATRYATSHQNNLLHHQFPSDKSLDSWSAVELPKYATGSHTIVYKQIKVLLLFSKYMYAYKQIYKAHNVQLVAMQTGHTQHHQHAQLKDPTLPPHGGP